MFSVCAVVTRKQSCIIEHLSNHKQRLAVKKIIIQSKLIYGIEEEGYTLLYTVDTWDKILKVLCFILEV